MLTRRQWLRVSAAAGLTVAGRLVGGCQPPPGPSRLGAATFEVTGNGALIAVHGDRPGPVWLELETPAGTVALPEVELTDDAGFTAVVELTDLNADADYGYRVVDGDQASAWFGFRTAPPPDLPAGVSFLFGADIDLRPQYRSPILATMAAQPAAFFVSMGDWPYADFTVDARTVDGYRVAHRAVRTAPEIQPLLERMPIYAIYDDHEVRNNWDGAFRETSPGRVAAALQVWDEWFPLRDRSSPRRRYRSIRWGSLVELFVLDTRLYRSPNQAPDGPDKTMLGADQKAWLLDALSASAARFKFLVTSVPLDTAHGDCWAAFRTERDAILQHIVDQGIGGVIALSADQHWFCARHLESGIKEFQVGPIAQDYPQVENVGPNVVAHATGYNVGRCTVRNDAAEIAVLDADGEPIYQETITP